MYNMAKVLGPAWHSPMADLWKLIQTGPSSARRVTHPHASPQGCRNLRVWWQPRCIIRQPQRLVLGRRAHAILSRSFAAVGPWHPHRGRCSGRVLPSSCCGSCNRGPEYCEAISAPALLPGNSQSVGAGFWTLPGVYLWLTKMLSWLLVKTWWQQLWTWWVAWNIYLGFLYTALNNIESSHMSLKYL